MLSRLAPDSLGARGTPVCSIVDWRWGVHVTLVVHVGEWFRLIVPPRRYTHGGWECLVAPATGWFVGTDDVGDLDWETWRGCKSSPPVRDAPLLGKKAGDFPGTRYFGCRVELDDRMQGIDTEALDGDNVNEAAGDSPSHKPLTLSLRTHLRRRTV